MEELVNKFAKDKLIKVTLSHEEDIKKLDTIGKVIKVNFPQAVLSIPRTTAPIAAAELLQNLPISDLTIEETPIEDVIRKVFKDALTSKVFKKKRRTKRK